MNVKDGFLRVSDGARVRVSAIEAIFEQGRDLVIITTSGFRTTIRNATMKDLDDRLRDQS